MLSGLSLVAGCAAAVGAEARGGADAVVLEQGQARAILIVSDDLRGEFPEVAAHRKPWNEAFADLAAAELDEHLALVAEPGFELEVRELAPAAAADTARAARDAGRTPIVIGGPALDAGLNEAIEAQGGGEEADTAAEAFAVRVEEGIVTIVGRSPKGALNGVYELLEQLGFRWFMPGEIGRVVPEGDRLALATQLTVQAPSFEARWLHGAHVTGHATWQRRTRQGGFFVPPAHGGVPRDVTDEQAIQQRADGIVANLQERDPQDPSPYIAAFGPPDRPRWFEDNEASLALDTGDYDPFLGSISRTDRLMWHYNQVLDRVDEQVPDANVRIVFYAYHSYFRPPVRKDEVDDRIVPAFAPITLCRVHGMAQEICREKEYYRTLMEGWGEAVPKIYKRGYYFNLACPGVPFSYVHRVRREIPIAHEVGVQGFRQEVITKWASETPSHYIAARLMWDHEADVDALLDDFYVKFFGPAAEPMGEYLELMDAALRDTDHHAGGSFDVIRWYPTDVRARADALLDEALGLTSGDVYAQRVQIFHDSFKFMEALVHMLKYRAEHHYVAAQAELDRMRAIKERLNTDYEIPMLHPRYSASYLHRFLVQATEQAYERVTEGNQLVAGLDNVWKFRIDPEDIGEDEGFHRPDYAIEESDIAQETGYRQPDPLEVAEAEAGDVSEVGHIVDEPWQRVRTSTITWDTLGLRYYKERPAWYRQHVEIPADAEGEDLWLWFGGVDDYAEVWVNGERVGEGSGAFNPFEFEVSDVVRPGEPNLVAVRVVNRGLSELGTGGIMAPVMFYARETELEQPEMDFPEFPLY